MVIEIVDEFRREAGEIVVPAAVVGEGAGPEEDARRTERFEFVGDVIGSDALAARDVDIDHDAAPEVEIETADGDVVALREVVAGRVGVGADVQRDAHIAEGQIRAGVHVGVDRAHERRIAGPHVDGRVDDR
jgi:hypothetical protein